MKCSEQWISARPETGGNFSQVIISAGENTGSSGRKGEVIITVQGLPPKVIVIIQDAASGN